MATENRRDAEKTVKRNQMLVEIQKKKLLEVVKVHNNTLAPHMQRTLRKAKDINMKNVVQDERWKLLKRREESEIDLARRVQGTTYGNTLLSYFVILM